jgi:hypothetical protein
MEAELFHEAGAVVVHRLGADEEKLADLGVGLPLDDELEDFALRSVSRS